jgi:hypothetical protein
VIVIHSITNDKNNGRYTYPMMTSQNLIKKR